MMRKAGGVGACLEGSEVDNAVDVGVRGEDLVEILSISEVDFMESRSFAANELDAVKSDLGGVV